MKDQVIAVLEAVRLTQGELANYLRSGQKNPKETLKRITGILASEDSVRATALLDPQSPSIVPSVDEVRAEAKL